MFRLDPPAAESPLGPIGLAAAVAHEVRRLLTPARAYAELALRQTGLSADVCQSLSATIAAAAACDEAMACLILAHGGNSICEPEQVVRKLSMHQAGIQASVEQSCAVPMSAPALEMILSNLVSNARRASSGGAPIQIRVEKRSTGNTHRVIIEVEDRGEGMTDEQQQRALIPFVSYAASSGLGLTICRHLVEMAGGILRISATPGDGTRVTISLPWASVEGLKRSA